MKVRRLFLLYPPPLGRVAECAGERPAVWLRPEDVARGHPYGFALWANFDLLSRTDFPQTNLGPPIFSKRVLAVFERLSSAPLTTLPIEMREHPLWHGEGGPPWKSGRPVAPKEWRGRRSHDYVAVVPPRVRCLPPEVGYASALDSGVLEPANGFPPVFTIVDDRTVELFVTDVAKEALERAHAMVTFGSRSALVHQDSESVGLAVDAVLRERAEEQLPQAPKELPRLFAEVWRRRNRIVLVGMANSIDAPTRVGPVRVVPRGQSGLVSALRSFESHPLAGHDPVSPKTIAKILGAANESRLAKEAVRVCIWRGPVGGEVCTYLTGAPRSVRIEKGVSLTSPREIRLPFRAPIARVVGAIQEILQATREDRDVRIAGVRAAIHVQVYKWREELVVVPLVGTYLESTPLPIAVPVERGYAGLGRALRVATRLAKSAVRKSRRVVRPTWKATHCPDERTWLAEAVVCSVYRGAEYGESRTELIAMVGVPRKKVWLGLPRSRVILARAAIDADVVSAIRQQHQRAEKARGKYKGR